MTRWLEGPLQPGDRVDTSTGCTIFPYELQRPTRDEAAARFAHIRHWSEPDRGGHFPALEQPDTFAAELTASFALVR